MKNSLNKNDFYNFLSDAFPQVSNLFEIRNLTPGNVSLEMSINHEHLRPGNTISGPTMFLLADVSFYLSILSKIGPESLAVTTNCSIDFLRKPSEKNLYSENRILKICDYLELSDKSFDGFINWVLELRKKLNIPHKLSEVINEKDLQLDRLSKMALEDPSTGGNPKKLSEADMKVMYQHSMSGTLF